MTQAIRAVSSPTHSATHNEAHSAIHSVPRPAAETLLHVRGVTVHYGSKCAVSGVDLEIPRGEITAVVGPSGCGKSTLLASLNRLTDLVPGCRVSGQILLEGSDIRDPGTDVLMLRRRVGMVFQKPNPFPLSIRRNFSLPLREHGVRDRRSIDQIMEASLRDVGLWDEVCDHLDASALQLSGGQQQRLCTARTLALRPEVILFDEPCSSLDPISSGVVEDLIVSLAGRVTIVIVTHDLAQARRIADRVAVFWVRDKSGQLIESGSRDEIFERPRDPMTRAYVNGLRS